MQPTKNLSLAMEKSLPCLSFSFDKKNISRGSSNGKSISISNVKNILHFPMDIYYHVKFCHNRRNGFCSKRQYRPNLSIKLNDSDTKGGVLLVFCNVIVIVLVWLTFISL